ncbi:Predicted hydrolase related to dienelactone hydrolase [Phaffia rhodozyma]|uniref:Predicted hydrolase related to dienelactone hydrolase n=1 Tax=Phaffia rhodozyma TaxID=264483 RepID=A0A0F7SFI6_PHARH|nr:Predicted hydrolase related to dienelactone hydrolase [Phaffia rhodozyma]
MSSEVQTNKACCTIPPVEAEYTNKGAFETIDGIKTYVTGDKDAKNLVIYVYDIFSYTPQAFQAADLIAAGTCAKVHIPDFFDGVVPDASLFQPPFTPEKDEAKQKLFSTTAAPPPQIEKLNKMIKQAKEAGIQKVGAVGFCWGAKICFKSPDLDAKAAFHPSLLAEEDTKDLNVPVALWPSGDEDKELMAKFEKALSTNEFASKNKYKLYEDRRHGWAAARADFKDETQKADFYESFVNLCKFFTSVL